MVVVFLILVFGVAGWWLHPLSNMKRTSAWNYSSLTFSLAASWHNPHRDCLVDTHPHSPDNHYTPGHLSRSILLEG